MQALYPSKALSSRSTPRAWKTRSWLAKWASLSGRNELKQWSKAKLFEVFRLQKESRGKSRNTCEQLFYRSTLI